jgi:hypothetical protein
MFHCVSHPFRPREVQAPIHEVDSEQEQGSIAAAQTSTQMSTLPIEAVVAGIAYRGEQGESSCLHAHHSHSHNHILSAHSRHIRDLPVQLAAEVEAEYSGPGHSHSRSHSHSHSHAYSQHLDMSVYMRPLLRGSREDARARAPCAVLAAARSTDPRHIHLDHRTARRRARTGAAHAREYHKKNKFP